MNKILLLCLLMALSGQAFARKNNLLEYSKVRSSASFKTTNPALGSHKNNLAITLFQELKLKRIINDTVQNSSDFPEFWPDRLYLKLKNGENATIQTYKNKVSQLQIPAHEKFNKVLQQHSLKSVNELPRLKKLFTKQNTYQVNLESAAHTQQLMRELKALPEVEYVEQVPYYVTLQSPNDPNYVNNIQYALHKTKVAEAFAIHTGVSKTLLAIVDDAVLISHPDLAGNINIPKSYDVADKDSDPRPPSSGPNKANNGIFSHGTHCAGIAGAITDNGAGVAAISNNKVSIIGVKCTRDNAASSLSVEYFYDGIVYAINQGARVISMSFGSKSYSQTFQNLINEATANGVIFVAAAGNDNDEVKFYPAAFDNVISVASTDANDLKSNFSTYGTWVDVAAPGSAILSTVVANDGVGGAYHYGWGTSMACPMVAGLVALMLSENPNLTPQAVTQLLKDTADPLEDVPNQSPALAGKLGGGRINAYRAIQAVKSIFNVVAPAAISDLGVMRAGQTELEIEWSAPAVNGKAASLYNIRYSPAPITATNFENATPVKHSLFPAEPGQKQKVIIKGLSTHTTYYFAIEAKSFYGVTSPLSNVASGSTLTAPVIQVNPDSYTVNLNSTNTSTNYLDFNIANVGLAPLYYKTEVVPLAGSNVLRYDKLQQTPDGYVGGLGNVTIICATKFIAGASGFNLTHVQNYLNKRSATNNVEVGIRILKGGTHPGNATLLTSEIATISIPARGKFLSLPLQTPQQFAPGEVFWIAFVLPWENTIQEATLQGYDRISANPGTFFLSTDNGNIYEDYQNIVAQAIFKIRAASLPWATLNADSSSIQPGASTNVLMNINAFNLPNGLYQLNASFKSNDPFNPEINRPLTLTITGGRPKFVGESVEKDFGTLFVGTSRTVKVLIANAGTDTLTVHSELKHSEPFALTEFNINTLGPLYLPPGKQQEVTVTFSPLKKGLLNGVLTLSSNDPEVGTIEVPLLANVISPPVAVITPANLNFEMDDDGVNTATAEVHIQNTGEAELTNTLQVLMEPLNSISYDANRPPENYLRTIAPYTTFHTALKFDVTTTAFNLTHVQNFIRTGLVLNKNVTIMVYKGGETPIAGTLVVEQTFEIPAIAADGALITFPLQQPYRFKQGDVFWIVFYFNGINQPQGFNTNNPNPGRNFFSYDGATWFTLESRTGLYTTSTYIMKALDMPEWLLVTPGTGKIAAGNLQKNTVSVNTAGLEKGWYKGKIEVMTNDPNQPLNTIEVNLNLEQSPVADFKANYTEVLPGEAIIIQNLSKYADAYEWQFAGTELATSILATPTVVYSRPGKYKVSLKAKNTQNGRTSETLVKEDYITVQDIMCQDLNYSFTDNAPLATNNSGYPTGNNTKGDLAKVNYFDFSRPDAYVTGVKVKFGAAVASSPDATIKIAVWDINSSNGKPESIIATKDINLTEIAADVSSNRMTEVVFDAPVYLTGSFFAGVILNNEVGNTVAIMHKGNTDTTTGAAWTLDSQHNWQPFGAAWPDLTDITLDIQPAITLTRNPISADFTMSAESVCAGEPVKLDASTTVGAVRYEWLLEGAAISNAAEVSPIITYTAAGTYKIILKAYDACKGVVVTSKNIAIHSIPDVALQVTGSTTLCAGENVTLSAVAGDGLTYLWSNGATTPSISISESGNYTVRVMNNTGCIVTSEEVKTVMHPLPAKPIINRNDVILTSDASFGNQWFRNNILVPNATKAVYDATEPGVYQVRVTNAGGCISEMSEEVIIKETDLIPDIKIYPNPAKGKFNLAFTGLKPDKVSLRIFDTQGKLVYEEKRDMLGNRRFQIDIPEVAAGIYLVKIQQNDRNYNRRIVVQH